MKKILSVVIAVAMLLSLVAPFRMPTASAANEVFTFDATNVTATGAVLNGVVGATAADDTDFWYGSTLITPTSGPSPAVPFGWTNVIPTLGAKGAGVPFSCTLTGLTPNTTYYFVAWVQIGGTWYPGAVKSFTTTPTTPTGVTSITISTADLAKKVDALSNPQYYYADVPIPGVTPTPFADGDYVYKMGDIIHGTVTFATVIGDPGVTVTMASYTIELLAYDGTDYTKVIDSVTAYEVAGIHKYPFQLSTGNVSYDGPYMIKVAEGAGDSETATYGPIFIQYNITWLNEKIGSCIGSNTISGYITRGQGQTVLVPVIIGVVDPQGNIIASYTVAPQSSGMFALSFIVGSTSQIGKFRIFVRDAYPSDDYLPTNLPDLSTPGSTDPDNDWMVYYTISNVPTLSMTVSTYITPFIYRGLSGQPLLLVVKNQDGDPVSGLTLQEWTFEGLVSYSKWAKGKAYSLGEKVIPTSGFHGFYYEVTTAGTSGSTEPTWPTTGPVNDGTLTWTAHQAVGYDEISPGFYRFVLNVPDTVDVRFTVKHLFYGAKTVTSNQLIIDTRILDVFNPYIDITAPNAMQYGEGTLELDSVQSVYDKLPCTVGNSFEIKVGSWDMPATKKADWYIPKSDIGLYGSAYAPNYSANAYWELNGPVVDVTDFTGYAGYGFGDTMKVLVTQAGKLSVTIHMTAWERVNKNCPVWNSERTVVSETEKSQNACCHTYEKTIDICEVKSCTYGGVTLSGTNVTDSKTVDVGKKVDKLSVSIDPTGAPTDLTCSCPNYVVLMYMIDGEGALVEDAFTVDTWGGTTVDGSMIWYNPQVITGPGIADQPIQQFKPSGVYDELGNPVTGGTALKFTDCPFGLQGITFNYPNGTSCGYTIVLKVFGLSRKFDACGNMIPTYPLIAEEFDPITVNPLSTDLTATYTLTEGSVDPDQMLAGIPAIIDVNMPTGFSYDKGNPYWLQPSWKYVFNGKSLSLTGITVTASKTGTTSYRFVLSKPFSSAGTFKIVGTSYYYNCTKKEVVTIEIEVVAPEFTVKIGLNDCGTDGIHPTIIDNDGYLTEGIDELVYVNAVDPRGVHDFSTDPNWTLSVSAVKNACGLYTSRACGVVEGPGCSYGLPIRVVGYDSPHLDGQGKVRLYFNSFGAAIKVYDFTLKAPEITVDPKEVPFTTPNPTNTHLTFSVKDAHGYPVSGIRIQIDDLGTFGVGASGYSWSATTGTTGCKGEVDWGFVPPYSGRFVIKALASPKITCVKPCSWPGINTTATIEAVYKAPVVDTEAPKVEVTAPAEVTTSTVKITGKATDNSGSVVAVWIGAKQASVAPDGTFEAVLDLVPGDNTFTVSAYDAANNVGTAKVTVKYVVPQVTKIVLKIGSDIMEVNGKAVQLDAAPEIKNGSTFLPLRAIAEAFGATVTWVPESIQGITVVLGDTQIGLQIGNNTAVVNGNVISIEPPYIKNSRTMVPFRVISEAFGADVQWDPINYIVTVTLQG
ncbi:MAG: hypothetical protein KBG04_04950 [Bacteroidales bacterium]|nr:hypothetical protein [Bacteroidales bacterium]